MGIKKQAKSRTKIIKKKRNKDNIKLSLNFEVKMMPNSTP